MNNIANIEEDIVECACGRKYAINVGSPNAPVHIGTCECGQDYTIEVDGGFEGNDFQVVTQKIDSKLAESMISNNVLGISLAEFLITKNKTAKEQ